MRDRPLVDDRTMLRREEKPSTVSESGRERDGRAEERRKVTSRLRTIKWFRRNYFAVVCVLLGILEFNTTPYQQIGFLCNDPKISFKFTGDTISFALLLSLSIILPLIVIWIAEYLCYSADSYESASCYGSTRGRQIWRWYGHYGSGITSLTFVIEIMKLLIGEPRPHFLDTCKPREAVNCTDEYFNSYTCTNTEFSKWFINDSSKSFPSGHSALSVYTSIFLVWYLQNRLPNRTLFLKPWLQCLLAMWAVTCSMTRVGDNRHHWWDVLAGDVLGLLFGLFVVVVSCRHFCLERTVAVAVAAAASAAANAGATHALNESLENGQIGGGYDMQRKHNTKKLLAPTDVVDVSEGREMKDATNWRE
ncbi:PREDICTED: lipid phosphate phosphohydrolase 1-like isoform X2 [Wasmannia auropunctata]|uniref:lipid phosphate phosphohydrolase 1-like isoform X2 n=1 Tax=Wasmannia auropunctata TaxID=64793 RepID=UPI0005EFFC63|nr:PREDICTED: lipid phosphate phosphohydrolase 1-like isoform X2 [Wasmannia auropunctata]